MKKLRFFDSLKLVLATVACVFAIVPAHAATLPAGYTELEYLQTDRNAYIDTGILLSTTDVLETELMVTNLSATKHMISTGGTIDSGFFQFAQTSSLLLVDFGTPSGGGRVSTDTITSFNNKVLLKANVATKEFYVNNTYIGNAPNSDFIGSANSIKLFSATGEPYIRIYSFKIVGKINLVPARRDSDGVLGMYDLADANPATAFHTNAGTGTFVAGPAVPIKIATTKYNEESFAPVKTDLSAAVNAVEYVVSNTMTQAQAIDQIANEKQTRPDEGCTAKYCLLVEDEDGTPHWYPIAGANGVEYVLPSGYTQLEYIESDGYSWIIVPYRVNNKTVFYARYNEIQKGTKVASAVFGVTSTPDASKANYGIVRLLDGTNNFNRMGWGDSTSGSVIGVDAPKNLNTWYEVLYDQNKLYQDNVLYATSATSNDTEWVANYDLGIFARNGATVTMPAIAKISSVWAKEDGEYKINLVPAKDSSGDVGMYDMVSGQFFTNRGTGVFGEGPVVE